MVGVTLEEIHEDIESLKRDMSELKSALLGDEGDLTLEAKKRIEEYLKNGFGKLISQEEVEKEFL